MGVYKNCIEPFLFAFKPYKLVTDGVDDSSEVASDPRMVLTDGLTIYLDYTPLEDTGDVIALQNNTGWGLRRLNTGLVFTKYNVIDRGLGTAGQTPTGQRTRQILTYAPDGTLRFYKDREFGVEYVTGTAGGQGPLPNTLTFCLRPSASSALACEFYEAAFFQGATTEQQVAQLWDSRAGAFAHIQGRNEQWRDTARGISGALLNGAHVIEV